MATNQSKIEELYAKVQAKKAAIQSAEQGNYQTDGIFRFSTVGQVHDIKTTRKQSTLVDMLAFLYERQNSHKKAAEVLGVEVEDTWMGADIKSWENDLRIRATQLNMSQEKAKLQKMEEGLLGISSELLEKVKLAEIEKALS